MGLFSSVGKFFSNAAKSAGKAVSSGVGFVAKAAGDIGNAFSKVPVVGGALHGIWSHTVGYVSIADNIVKGVRIDKAISRHLESELKNVKEVAPYAQTVIAVVPGIGPVASGAIGAGLALASGQPIDQAIEAGIAGTIPGGAIAKVAFDAGKAVIQGKSPAEIGLAAAGNIVKAVGVPVPDIANKVIGVGLEAAKAAVNGKRVDSALLSSVIDQLPANVKQVANAARDAAGGAKLADVLLQQGQNMIPGLSPDARKALNQGLNIGMAVAQGKNLQTIAIQQLNRPEIKQMILNSGKQAIQVDKILQQGQNLLKGGVGTLGYQMGAGLMSMKSGVNDILAVRNQLSGPDKKGFDMATAAHIGRVTHKAAPLPNSTASAAYLITKGMQGAAPAMKMGMMQTIAATPSGAEGAKIAIKQTADNRKGWWDKFLELLGFGATPAQAKAATNAIHGEWF